MTPVHFLHKSRLQCICSANRMQLHNQPVRTDAPGRSPAKRTETTRVSVSRAEGARGARAVGKGVPSVENWSCYDCYHYNHANWERMKESGVCSVPVPVSLVLPLLFLTFERDLFFHSHDLFFLL